MLNKILAIFLAIFVAVSGWLFLSRQNALEGVAKARNEAALYQRSYLGEKAAVEALKASHKTQLAALQKRAKQAEAQAKANKEQAGVLARALRDFPAWSETPIPQGIQDAFRDPAPQPTPTSWLSDPGPYYPARGYQAGYTTLAYEPLPWVSGYPQDQWRTS